MNIGGFFKKLVHVFRSPKAQVALNQIEDILPQVVPIVQAIAVLTPNRTDDEIVAAAERFSVVLPKVRAMSKEERLRAIARLAVAQTVRLPIKESTLNAAIELALTIHKNQ